MKNLASIQLELFKHSRNANEYLNAMILVLQKEIKNPDLSPHKRKMLKKDVRNLLGIMKQIRDLDVMDSFYNPPGTYPGGNYIQDVKRISVRT